MVESFSIDQHVYNGPGANAHEVLNDLQMSNKRFRFLHCYRYAGAQSTAFVASKSPDSKGEDWKRPIERKAAPRVNGPQTFEFVPFQIWQQIRDPTNGARGYCYKIPFGAILRPLGGAHSVRPKIIFLGDSRAKFISAAESRPQTTS